jgi:competence protein ComEC
MRSVAVPPALALLAGTWGGIEWPGTLGARGWFAASLIGLWLLALHTWSLRRDSLVFAACMAGFLLAGLRLGGSAAVNALSPPLRSALDRAYGDFALDSLGPAGRHMPQVVTGRLIEDAALWEDSASIRVDVDAVRIDGIERRAAGGLILNVGGTISRDRAIEWRAGRSIRAPVTFRRPARYFNDGVPDFERQLALDGTALLGSVKSALLVEVVGSGTAVQEVAAAVRAAVRRTVSRWVHDPLGVAIVTAILIGDRTGLPDDIRARLQAAGTYHVIAISGGNIAILVALITGLLAVGGVSGRSAYLVALVMLVGYVEVVTSGPSVWRATLMAVIYFTARLIDHRSPPLNAIAVSGAVLACAAPLDVRNVGFVLTFGATLAIVDVAGTLRPRLPRNAAFSFPPATVVASFAVEVVLLPISASAFSRATAAGLVLNLFAVPLMTLAQVAGMVVVGAASAGWVWAAAAAGWVASMAARALVESASLVDALPWLSVRVPPPAVIVIVAYYAAMLTIRAGPASLRPLAAIVLCGCGTLIVSGSSAPHAVQQGLRLTVFDVGQGDALLLQVPGADALVVDSGGAPFGGGPDIGSRVLTPALWARGVRRVGTLVLTHGDPDHIGGARALLNDFDVVRVWEGIPVLRHMPRQEVLDAAHRAAIPVEQHYAGDQFVVSPVRLRVLHPPPADWERRRVRNDDSLVIEVRYQNVALLLTGDIGAEVERSIVPHLSQAPVRILKVAHHGSRTSTSEALLRAWAPQVAVISCGRGNRFGHPAPEVLRRLEAARARVVRTDRDGEVTIDTDGRTIHVKTFR